MEFIKSITVLVYLRHSIPGSISSMILVHVIKSMFINKTFPVSGIDNIITGDLRDSLYQSISVAYNV